MYFYVDRGWTTGHNQRSISYGVEARWHCLQLPWRTNVCILVCLIDNHYCCWALVNYNVIYMTQCTSSPAQCFASWLMKVQESNIIALWSHAINRSDITLLFFHWLTRLKFDCWRTWTSNLAVAHEARPVNFLKWPPAHFWNHRQDRNNKYLYPYPENSRMQIRSSFGWDDEVCIAHHPSGACPSPQENFGKLVISRLILVEVSNHYDASLLLMLSIMCIIVPWCTCSNDHCTRAYSSLVCACVCYKYICSMGEILVLVCTCMWIMSYLEITLGSEAIARFDYLEGFCEQSRLLRRQTCYSGSLTTWQLDLYCSDS